MGLKMEVGKFYRDANGEKRGPMRKDPEFNDIWDQGDDDRQGDYHWHGDGGKGGGAFEAVDLIAEWPADDAPTGPVRTVTTREIVPGVYDGLDVGQAVDGYVFIAMGIQRVDAEDIDALIANLTAIRDALEDNHADHP